MQQINDRDARRHVLRFKEALCHYILGDSLSLSGLRSTFCTAIFCANKSARGGPCESLPAPMCLCKVRRPLCCWLALTYEAIAFRRLNLPSAPVVGVSGTSMPRHSSWMRLPWFSCTDANRGINSCEFEFSSHKQRQLCQRLLRPPVWSPTSSPMTLYKQEYCSILTLIYHPPSLSDMHLNI